ncbi:alpha/beta hydrolase [Dactylosporangium aurantiacum]|uniref:Alpha/beta hydrolase n=1 Tax=Dactylosporangium aurantiacum TaxID=35754 RepID=A0A9Q9IE16_9ACTN|nr:alpha/beta hydrolase [Dactylosporangium aurantiacum]MDG6107184.1 alpha/beta hydrolase [Dactylosporangium aurantiacum]UWZ51478.1 alpha/beta hydrolase [Dactylosporangium aurantiacum]
MRRVTVRRDDVTISALAGGSGPPVVLLHGLAGSAAELVPTATGLLDAYTVVVPDQRGHGHSTRRPADVSRDAYVADVVAVLDALTGPAAGPAVLVGQSMGAHTAMLAAARHPDRVRGLVMLEGGVGGDDGDYPSRLGAWFASWPVPFPSREAAVAFLGGRSLARVWAADLEERADGYWPRFDAAVMTAAIRGVADVARWDEWATVRAPALLVRGAGGTGPPDEVERMLRLRPGTGHVVVPDAGHDVHLDQPAAWLTVLRGFLDTLG